MVEEKKSNVMKGILRFLVTGAYWPPVILLFEAEYYRYFLVTYCLLFCTDIFLRWKSNAEELSLCDIATKMFVCYFYVISLPLLNKIAPVFICSSFCGYIFPVIRTKLTDAIVEVQSYFSVRARHLQHYPVWKSLIYFILSGLLCALSILLVCAGVASDRIIFKRWHTNNGVTVIDNFEIETKDCIPYTSFPRQLWFDSTDMEATLDIYRSNKSSTYLSSSTTISSPLQETMKLNSKLCKSYRGDNLHIRIEVPEDNYSELDYVYYWTLNGSRIGTFSSDVCIFCKYNFWFEKYQHTWIFHLLINEIQYADFGTYVLLKRSKPNQNALPKDTQKPRWNSGGIFLNDVDEDTAIVNVKIVKVLLTNYEERYHQIYSEVGTLVKLNNFFARSFQHSKDPSWKKFKSETVYKVNGRDIRKVCPMPESCYSSVSRYHHLKKEDLFSRNTINEYPLTTTKVIVSFCVCPEAYGIHELYFHSIRAPVRFRLLPPYDVLRTFPYTALFKNCFNDRRIGEYFDMLMESNSKRKYLYEDMKTVFYTKSSEESRVLTLLIVLLFGCCLLINKLIRVVRFAMFSQQDIAWTFTTNMEKEFDVCLLYLDESVQDEQFVFSVVLPFLKDDLRFTVCSQEEIQPGQNMFKRSKELIRKSRTVILVLSREYLYSEQFKIVYDFSLLSAKVASMISPNNVLVVQLTECPATSDPLTKFRVIDWNDSILNLSTEDEKKQDLKRWLHSKLKRHRLTVLMLEYVVNPIKSRIIWFYYAGS